MFTGLQDILFYICQEKDGRFEKFEDEVTLLKKPLEKLEYRLDENDSYERRDILVLSGSAVRPIDM